VTDNGDSQFLSELLSSFNNHPILISLVVDGEVPVWGTLDSEGFLVLNIGPEGQEGFEIILKLDTTIL